MRLEGAKGGREIRGGMVGGGGGGDRRRRLSVRVALFQVQRGRSLVKVVVVRDVVVLLVEVVGMRRRRQSP